MESPKQIKRKQRLIAVGGFSAFLVILVVGMWLSDPDRGKPSALELERQRSQEVVKNYAEVGRRITSEEGWISRSERQMLELQRENQAVRRTLEAMIKDLERIGVQLEEAKRESRSVGSSFDIGNNTKEDGLAQDEGEDSKEVKSETKEEPAVPGILGRLPPPPPPSGRPGEATPFPGDASARDRMVTTVVPQTPGRPGQPTTGATPVPERKINVIDMSPDPATEGELVKHFTNYMPAGSFITTSLLAGVDAHTGGRASKDPIPVLMRLIDRGQLPNYFNSDVEDCHVIGAAAGDISSERVNIRTETLSCIMQDGRVIEVPMRGYVAGEDGKAGFRGRLVSKQGAMMAQAMLAGIASGLGEVVSGGAVTTQTSPLGTVSSIDPDKLLQAGIGGGASRALEKAADYYIARANEIFPVLEVSANRRGEIVLTSGVDFKEAIVGNMGKSK
jgi:conjugal transfer pilus assembly protein TraB